MHEEECMETRSVWLAAGIAAALGAAGCTTVKSLTGMGEAPVTTSSTPQSGGAYIQSVTLSGANEVPPVTTSASGTGTVAVAYDGSVAVSITVKGMTPTAAHIHEGAPGANGGVMVPLVKQGDNTFVAGPTARLTTEQLNAFKSGNSYVNVHSAANPGGEIRAQLKGN